MGNDDKDIEVGGCYKGRVRSIKPFGAFIILKTTNNGDEKLQDGRRSRSNNIEGLCHISQIADYRINSPEEILSLNQEVFVKVQNIQQDGKISLTMKNIDQKDGKEIYQSRKRHYQNDSNGYQQNINTDWDQNENQKQKIRKNVTDSWEMSQISKAYGTKKKEILATEEFSNVDPFLELDDVEQSDVSSEEEDIEIEKVKDNPPFLKDKKYDNSRKTLPIHLVKSSEGVMNRIASNGSSFMRDSKETRIKNKKMTIEKERSEKAQNNYRDPLSSSDITPKVSNTQISEVTVGGYSKAYIEWQRQRKNESYGKKTKKSMQEQRESLPVFKTRDDLLKAVHDNDFLVIVGETGSGKTTQITQYLAEDGFGNNGIIACTQPRRVAAISVAKRVADEVGCHVGDEVGYTIRFEDVTSDKTIIKYMTDGMLQREALVDPDMNKYSAIMLDEAHERTVATDVLFALLKKAVIRRKGTLKLIATSATLDATKFSNYFNDCPVLKIPGRTYPVEIFYSVRPEMDYIAATLESIIQIHLENPSGDILVFLTGREEIDTCCETLVDRMKVLYNQHDDVPELIILPIYSALPSEMQSRIFEPTPKGKRKVILATNIAETSVTIDGILYVIDPGFVKINVFDPRSGMDSLIISPISKAQANQRAGRAGRTGPGKCYRLYTKTSYEHEMLPNTVPEIQRQNLSNTILMLKAMNISNVLEFEFMDPPTENAILTALNELYILEALDDEGNLTEIGRYMAYFPMEPSLSKTLIKSIEFGCSEEMLTIVSMLSVPDIFFRPKEKREIADKVKAKFHDYNGDHLTFLHVYEKWRENNYSKNWCQDNFIHEKSLRRARDVRKQLIRIIDQIEREEARSKTSNIINLSHGQVIRSCRGNLDQVRKALVSGFFKNSAKKSSEESVFNTLADNVAVHIYPSSSLFKKSMVDYVIYHSVVMTTKEYMHCVTKIDPKWLVKYAPKFFRACNEGELSSRKKSMKIQPLFDRFDPKQSWRISRGRR
ncbi:hypothetical protein B5S29_g4886 [[Candida] boidinii]|nr:hypothetical protein B5S29_g4886 [[Candida] boidinii]